MKPALFLKVWGVAAFVFVTLDMIWLSLIMGKTYSRTLGFLGTLKNGRIQFNLPVGLLTQLIIITGMVLILTRLFLKGGNLTEHLLFGLLLGFTIYATYDLTNLSFIKNWPLSITIIDILWGTFQGGITGLVVWFLTR